jgi:hypothetical protein
LFYPPLFHVVLAGAYAVLGISEASALLVELGFLLLLAWGAFRLSRNWLDPPAALAVSVLLIAAPDYEHTGLPRARRRAGGFARRRVAAAPDRPLFCFRYLQSRLGGGVSRDGIALEHCGVDLLRPHHAIGDGCVHLSESALEHFGTTRQLRRRGCHCEAPPDATPSAARRTCSSWRNPRPHHGVHRAYPRTGSLRQAGPAPHRLDGQGGGLLGFLAAIKMDAGLRELVDW